MSMIMKAETIKKVENKFSEALKKAMKEVTAETKVSISEGNSKMGSVPSFSVMPFITCGNAECKAWCYAGRMANRLNNVMHAYAINTAMVIKYPTQTAIQIVDYIMSNNVRFFRFNVAGDFNLVNYMGIAWHVVRTCKNCQFLSFTKAFDHFNEFLRIIQDIHNDTFDNIFPNWHVLYSGYTADNEKKPNNPYNFPETIVYINDYEYIKTWFQCGGLCEECACKGVGCWQLKKGDTLAFRMH